MRDKRTTSARSRSGAGASTRDSQAGRDLQEARRKRAEVDAQVKMCLAQAGDVVVTQNMILWSAEKYRQQFRFQKKDTCLSKITHLHLNNCRITIIGPDIAKCKGLRVLYLYENNISCIQNLGCFHQLTHLYLQNNNISKIEGMDALVGLKKLYLDRNHIHCIENLGSCCNLEELHISQQTLPLGSHMKFDAACMKLLGEHESLRVVHAAANKLADPQPLAWIGSLRRVDLASNGIRDVQGVLNLVLACTLLSSLNLKGCPIAKNNKWKDQVIRASESLNELNGETVPQNHREFLIRVEKLQKSKRPADWDGQKGLQNSLYLE